MPTYLAMPMPVSEGSRILGLVLHQENNAGVAEGPMAKGEILFSQIKRKKKRKDFL
jgi:hypothetical protein